MKRIGLFIACFWFSFASIGQIADGNPEHERIDSLRFALSDLTLAEVEPVCKELQALLVEKRDTVSYCWGGFLLSSKLAKFGNNELAFAELEKVKKIAFEYSDSILQNAYWQSLACIMYAHMEQIIGKNEAYEEADVINDSIQSFNDRSLTAEVLERDPFMYTRGLIFQAMAQRWVSEEEEALKNMNMAEELVRKHGFDFYRISVLNIRATILVDIDRIGEAAELYQYALEKARKDRDTLAIETISYNYGVLLFNANQDKKALEMFLLSYNLGIAGETSADQLFIGAESIKDCYYFLGDYENAFEWAEIAHEHHKAFETSELRLRFEKMQIEAANLENERLAFQHAQERLNAEEEAEKQKQTKLIIGAIGILVILMLAVLYWFNQIKARNKLLEHEKQVSELIRKQEISSMEAMISGQEGERKRLGRELHDHIGSMLSTLGMHFSSAFEKATGKEVSEVNEAKRVLELLDNTVTETRKLSHDMMTGVLNKFGLVSALRDLCDQISETGKVNVRLNSIGMDERLDAMQELNLYRISQELVSNALKHASPTTIQINLVRKKESIVLQVKDDGVGMTNDQFESGNGAGFTNISGRIAALHGKLEFGEKQETGTLIRIIVPLLSEKQ